MISPFSFTDAKPFLLEMNRAEDAASLLEQTLHEFDEAIMEEEPAEPLPESLSIRTWIGCCLLDAVLNGTDYIEQAEQYGMSDEFRLAVRVLDEALTRKKGFLFFKKPIVDVRALVWNARECLMLFVDDETELIADHAQSDETWAEFMEAIGELHDRLDRIYDSLP